MDWPTAFVSVGGSVLVAWVAWVTNSRTLRQQDSRRHEETKRDAYQGFEKATEAIVTDVGHLREVSGTFHKDGIGWATFKDAATLVDIVGSPDAALAAREVQAVLMQVAYTDDGEFLTRAYQELTQRRDDYLKAVRRDLGLAEYEPWTPESVPISTEQDVERPLILPPIEETRPLGRLERLKRAWRG